jgi:hypothetical protein
LLQTHAAYFPAWQALSAAASRFVDQLKTKKEPDLRFHGESKNAKAIYRNHNLAGVACCFAGIRIGIWDGQGHCARSAAPSGEGRSG